MKRIKVFFVVKALHQAAGTERSTILVANGLAGRGHDVRFIVSVKEGEPFFPVDQRVKMIYLHSKADKRPSLVRDFDRRRKLRQIYLAEQPDVVVIVGSGRSMLNIPAARGFKTITWEHFNANVIWHLMHPLSKLLAGKLCDRIVTLTQQDADLYLSKYGAKAVCIPNALTLDNPPVSPIREKKVLAIGRLMKQKGFDMLLDAWHLTKERKNGWVLRIVGTGKMRKLLDQKINQFGLEESVEILPTTPEVVRLYSEASIYVMSSRFEGLPLVLLEAMQMGLPIVSFDCETGPREIIVQNKTGILVPPNNIEGLASALDRLMANPELRKMFAQNNLQQAKKFEPSVILDRWEGLLNELIAE